MAFGSEIAKLFVRIGADISELKAGLGQALSETNTFANGVKRAGNNLSQVGRTLTTGLTLPIVGLGALALKTSIDFESAFAGVRKTVDATEPEFARLRQGIRDMAKEMPLSASKIAGVAEAAGQLGVKKDDILAFTKTMVMLGATTNLSANEAATAFARFANVMQVPLKDVGQLADVLVNLGNKSATTEKEIMDMAQRLASAGHIVGMSATEVLAWSAALSSVGIEAEAGGSAISRTFVEVANAVASLNPSPEVLKEIADATHDVRDASDNLATAQRSVRDAGEGVSQAQRGVRDALEGVEAAQRASRNATEALRDAYSNLARAQRDQRQASLDSRRETLSVAEAMQGLREVQAQAGSGALELRSAQLAVAEAQKRLAEASKKGGLEQAQAALGVQQAQQRLNQVMVQGPRYNLDLRNAQLRLEEAQNRVGSSARDQADKMQQASRNVRNATENVNDARRNERNAAEGVSDANRSLRNAYEGVTEAQKGAVRASDSLVDAQKKLDDLTKNNKLAKFAEVAGMSVQEFADLFNKDPSTAMLRFIQGLDRVAKSGGNVFAILDQLGLSEVRQRNALLSLANAGPVLSKSIEDAFNSAGAAEREFAERNKTTASQLQEKWNRITDSLITFGDALKPILLDLLDAAEPFFRAVEIGAQAFANLPGPVQKVIVGLALLVAVVGPLLIVVGALASSIGAIIALAGILGVSLGTLALIFVGIPLLIAAIVVAGYLLYKNWDTIKAAAKNLGDTIVGAFNAVLQFLGSNWREVATLLAGPFSPLVALATDAFGVRSALWGALKAVLDWVSGNWASIATLISSPFVGLVTLALDLFGLRSAIQSGLNSAWSAVKKFFDKLGQIKVRVNTTAGGIIPTGFSISIPSYAQGTPYVPQDMLAFIHQGEMVVPRGIAETMRTDGRGLTAKTGAGGLSVEVNGPVKIVNQGRRQDTTGAMGDLAFGVAGHLRRRGVYT